VLVVVLDLLASTTSGGKKYRDFNFIQFEQLLKVFAG